MLNRNVVSVNQTALVVSFSEIEFSQCVNYADYYIYIAKNTPPIITTRYSVVIMGLWKRESERWKSFAFTGTQRYLLLPFFARRDFRVRTITKERVQFVASI